MLSLKLVGGVARADGARTTAEVPPAQPRYTIGRDPACDWALPDRTLALSARHCEIVQTPTGPLLRDLSTNGTFVNDASTRLLDDHLLRHGDRFDAGPFSFEVSVVAGVTAADLDLSAPSAPALRSPAVDETAPLVAMPRGRDPAAVAAAALPPPAADADLGLTRIRPAPRPAAAPAVPAAMPVPPPSAMSAPLPAPIPAPASAPVPAPMPVPAPVAVPTGAGADAWRAALAQGLGVPAHSLAGQDPLLLAQQLGALARASVDSLRSLLEQQSRSRRRIGSRRQAALRAASPLQLADSSEAALLALLASTPGPAMAQATADLARHQDQLLAAYRGAVQRLAEDLAPATLAQSLPGADAARHWALYGTLWQRLGLVSDDAPWPAGMVEAALLHLAAAYDQD
ncbi:MAG: type VI secretion system-associated FHA domain protein TagH [Rubrivivax sp.]|nr:type VI secretion system-associated FHA domain protein TagH [Rubrivivax sp.]